jgi:uncharacterized membrane protein
VSALPAPLAGLPAAILLHLAGAAPALLLGAVQLARPKGDRAHRALGAIWTGCMALAVASSFAILTGGGPSWIHLLSLWVAVSLALGLARLRRGDARAHGRWMGGACLGLLVAFGFALAPWRLLGGWLWG